MIIQIALRFWYSEQILQGGKGDITEKVNLILASAHQNSLMRRAGVPAAGVGPGVGALVGGAGVPAVVGAGVGAFVVGEGGAGVPKTVEGKGC